jgi:hypothetical protein
MADPVSDAGYALIAIGLSYLLAAYVVLAYRGGSVLGPLPAVQLDVIGTSDVPSDTKRTPSVSDLPAPRIPYFCAGNIVAAALLAFGNIIVYRIVLAEQLLGTVLAWGHGPMAIATTILIVGSLVFLIAHNLVLLGSARPPRHPRRFAAAGLGALFVVCLILFAKLGMGTIYYANDFCQCNP